MNCLYDQPVFVSTDKNGDEGRTRSIWPYFKELLLQAGAMERRRVELSCRAL